MKLREYALVTAAYWVFTVTDGALRMLVLLHFHELGYNAVSLAFLFLLYELFGVFTNLVGGWIGSQHGLKITLIAGLTLQVAALLLLSAHSSTWAGWAAVAWVMGAQALSGIAKDLTKMSSKTAVKYVASEGALFKFVAILTGSKNALKGVGFFVGAALLSWVGFDQALWVMAACIAAILLVVLVALGDLGRADTATPLKSVLNKSAAIQRLSLARFFLFGSRDIWFVVALPVFLDEQLGWSHEATGAFLAVWVIGYGGVQSLAPRVVRRFRDVSGAAAAFLMPMAMIVLVIAFSIWIDFLEALLTVIGLLVFGVLFALTSSVHSYLILAYSEADAALDVGYYYSANAAGRLIGTLLSGVLFVIGGFPIALVGAATFLLVSLVVSMQLPPLGPMASNATSG